MPQEHAYCNFVTSQCALSPLCEPLHKRFHFILKLCSQPVVTYRNHKLTDWEAYKTALTNRITPPPEVHRNVEQIEACTGNIRSGYETSCPLRRIKKTWMIPWWNPPLQELRKEASWFVNMAMRTKFQADWNQYKAAQHKYKSYLQISKK